METRHWIVKGSVQGVGFRYSTLEVAQQLKLVGWVRNLTTGEVEVLAQGDSSAVDQLEAWLQQGPSMAKVIQIISSSVPPQALTRFEQIATASNPQPF